LLGSTAGKEGGKKGLVSLGSLVAVVGFGGLNWGEHTATPG
jgi:hypothetical protein